MRASKELIELAKAARVPIHRVPRLVLDRALPGFDASGRDGEDGGIRLLRL